MLRNFNLIKRKVKYIRLEIKDFKLNIIVPKKFDGNIGEIVEKHKKWLEKKFVLLEEIKNLSQNLKIYNHNNLEEIVAKYINEVSLILNVKPTKVYFRLMKVRWGSCSRDGKIILSKKLKFLPKELIKYFVIHEMCHLLIKNHRKEFWLLVKKLCPDFKEKEKMLAGYKVKIHY
jgi:predicted metal-dependent hydrolase